MYPFFSKISSLALLLSLMAQSSFSMPAEEDETPEKRASHPVGTQESAQMDNPQPSLGMIAAPEGEILGSLQGASGEASTASDEDQGSKIFNITIGVHTLQLALPEESEPAYHYKFPTYGRDVYFDFMDVKLPQLLSVRKLKDRRTREQFVTLCDTFLTKVELPSLF